MAESTSGSTDAGKAAVNRKRSAVNKTASSDWSWEDEMLMYDVCHRDSNKVKRRNNARKDGTQAVDDERKRLQKDKQMEALHMQECRKLFLGGLSYDTVRRQPALPHPYMMIWRTVFIRFVNGSGSLYYS